MKKMASLWLASVMLVGFLLQLYVPVWGADEDYAWYQAPVDNLVIMSQPSTQLDLYNLRMAWNQPGNYTLDTAAIQPNDSNANPQDRSPSYAERFDIYYRNATARQTLGAPRGTTPGEPAKGVPFSYMFNNLLLDRNSLYEFIVTPVRNNKYKETRYVDGLPVTTIASRPAPVDNSGLPEIRGLLLTYIDVTAKGAGNTLTVTWHNPTFDGVSVFTGYDIYYTPFMDTTTPIEGRPVSVSLNDPNLVINAADGTLTYTIRDNDLEIGRFYSVKVEPRINNVPVRTQQISRVDVNGRTYSLTYKTDDYRYDEAYVSPALNVQAEGSEQVRLTWSRLKEGSTGDNPVLVEIYESVYEDMSMSRRIGYIEGSAVFFINSWLASRPSGTMYYQIIITDALGRKKESEIARFDAGYNDFTPYKPEIKQTIPQVATEPYTLDITWLAFTRPVYDPDTEEEDPFYNAVLDQNLVYDIYITDAVENFNDPLFMVNVVDSIHAKNLTPFPWPNATVPNPVPAYKNLAPLTQYYARNPETGAYELKDLEDNKVYYIRIIAIRDPSGQTSQPSDASVYMPPVGPIALQPQMLAAPPLRVKKDAGVEVITEESIAVEWDQKFIEIYNPADERWYATVGVDENGILRYGKDVNAIKNQRRVYVINDLFGNIHSLNTADPDALHTFLNNLAVPTLESALLSLDPNVNIPSPITLRVVDLTGASYKMHVVAYDYMMQNGGYEAYEARFLTGSAGELNWQKIEADNGMRPGSLEYPVTRFDQPEPGDSLRPNSPYVIYLIPYITIDGVETPAYYPNYVMATTLETQRPVEIDPTTPVLEAVSQTDRSVTVRWAWVDIEYDLAYSDRLADYAESGILIPWSTLRETAYKEEVDGVIYMYYEIKNLFPDTLYYVWAKSRAINPSGSKESRTWSNPVDIKTLDIVAPLPPNGLGAASKIHVDSYNRENTTAYTPIEANAMIIEWMRDSNDSLANPASGETTESYGAVTAIELSLDEMLNMYMVRFENLIANRSYYIRAKTVMTVTKQGTTGDVQRLYSYIVQLSPDALFSDYIEFVIPPIAPFDSLDPVYAKRKESDWTATIRLVSGTTDTEYDGDVNPDHYPLPEQDWDIVYDPYTNTLTYRFRSNQTDASGVKDQNADQRFISRLLAERTFIYSIDLTHYNNRLVTHRVVEIPYSIIKAFAERKITLEITADNVTVSFTPNSLANAQVKALPNAGVNASVKLSISADTANLPPLSFAESYVSAPKQLKAQVITSTRTVNVEHFAEPVALAFKLDSNTVLADQHVGLYSSSADSGGWSRLNATYVPGTGEYRYNTYSAAAFAGISKTAPTLTDPYSAVRDAYYTVASRIQFTDLKSFDPAAPATANRVNNLIVAVALNRSSVAVDSPLSAVDAQALSRGKMLVSSTMGYALREAGIDALVTLYELKTKRIIAPSETLADLANVSAAYRKNLQKAVNIGFVSEIARPKEVLTMGDLMEMLSIILLDAGL